MVNIKTKSGHHKSTNTFRFQTFHERLANVNIDVARKLGKFSATPEDAETFFGESLEKWTDLNCTQNFCDFRKEISGEYATFIQLVHNQNEITEALLKHLQVNNSLALQPLLDLVVQLARDLQGDFYPHYEKFFEIIVTLLNNYHHEVPVLEQAFTCLAYLFKFLWRLMLRDIQNVYRIFSPLLGDQYKEYINTFAAESFSFLMRKVKSQSDMLDFMFQGLRENPDQAQGVGVLLFEMIKGVQKQFHSSAEKSLPIVLSKICDENLPSEEVMECLEQMCTSIVEYTHKDHSAVIFQCIVSCIEGAVKSLEVEETQRNSSYLSSVLRLMEILVSHKAGWIVGKGEIIVQCVSSMLKETVLPTEEPSRKLLDVVAALLMGENCELRAEYRPRLINLVYRSKYPRSIILNFSRKVFDLPLFEKDLLPALLIYCHQQCINESLDQEHVHIEILDFLTSLTLHKSPPWEGVMNPESLKLYMVDLSYAINKSRKSDHIGQDFCSWVLASLIQHNKEFNARKDGNQLARIWSLLYIIPQLRPISVNDCANTIMNTILLAQDQVLEEQHQSTFQDTTTVLYEGFISLLHLLPSEDFCTYVKASVRVADLLRKLPDNVTILRLADICFTVIKKENALDSFVSEKVFNELLPVLRPNLSSPYHKVRLHTLHICEQFVLPMPLPPDDREIAQPGVFAICLAVEQITLHVHSYRDALVHLRKLEYQPVQLQLPVGEQYEQIPLLYLIGTLFVNFKLLWAPAIGLIRSHAMALNVDTFWDVYQKSLEQAADQTEKKLLKGAFKHQPVTPGHYQRRRSSVKLSESFNKSSQNTLLELEGDANSNLLKYHMKMASLTDKVDWINYRELLWKSLLEFPSVCEPRSRILSPMLFRFIENEYDPEDETASKYHDLRKRELRKKEKDSNMMDVSQSCSVDNNQTEQVAPNEEEEGEEQKLTNQNEGERKRTKRASNKTFVMHLQLFALFHDPRSIYLEPKLKELYLRLLQHLDGSLQQVAFDCIMTYKYNYLTPYKENFCNLLDDKSFKRELVQFSIDESTSTIQEEHRHQLIPILMRILHGKMQSKSGKDKGSNNYLQVKKSSILRFLAGSSPTELKIFLDIFFEAFDEVCKGNIRDDVKKNINFVDLSKVIPLRKQQGMLDTLEIIMHKLGHLLDEYKPKMLKILTCLASQYVYMLEQRESLKGNTALFVKNLRQIVTARIIQFFESFDRYEYSLAEVEAVFDSVVWPSLEKLSFEGVYSTTGLLKLLFTWSDNSRYYPLLAKVHPTDNSVSPLRFVFELLHGKNVHKTVVKMIMEFVENLLTVEDFEATDNVACIDAGDIVKLTDNPDITVGTQLILPHVESILDHLKTVVIKMNARVKNNKTLPERQLNILSKLSEHVESEEQSCTIVSLLLPFLGKRLHRSVDVEVDILTTVKHLISKVNRPELFVEDIAKLFSIISQRQSRTVLCQVLDSITTKVSVLQPVFKLVLKLNAWDRKRVDEPDYMTRLEGFQESQKLFGELLEISKTDQENTTTNDENAGLLLTSLCQVLVHNCNFILSTTDDMSLRDNSSFCLQELVKALTPHSHLSNIFTVVVEKNILPEIKDKLRITNEAARHEYINILALLVRSFPEYHIFKELVPLTDDSDPEVDFFNNIVHIQLHRRVRALQKLCKYVMSSDIKAEVLVYYTLPYITCFVIDPQYAKLSNVMMDASIKAIGAISGALPWRRYMLLVKFYVEKLLRVEENQKTIVKIVVSILDNFHFDLRHSRGVNNNTNKAPIAAKPTAVCEGKDVEVNDEDNNDVTEDNIGDKGIAEVVTKTVTSLLEQDESQKGDDEKEHVMKFLVCDPALATHIHSTIVNVIVVKLYQTLTRKAKSDDQHKLAAAGKYAEDEEVLRVPIALAMIKLLQALPGKTLEKNLPHVLLKVCHFLRSRSQDIRKISRDTLVQILKTLGPRYFSYILKELKSTLQRGYQLHVLCYTVWALLNHLHNNKSLQSGDLDTCIESLVDVFNMELFSHVAEEKEIEGIKGKIHEARSSKSYDSYALLALYISKSSLPKMIVPLKKELDSTKNHINAKKAGEVLRRISNSIVENKGLELEMLLTFIYGLVTETLPFLQEKDNKESKKKHLDPRMKPTDTYTVHREPKRGGKKPKVQVKTNLYIIVDFGFQVLNMLLKRTSVVATNKEHLQLLDPFVKPVCDSLSSKYIKVTTTAMRCLLWLLKFPLPAVKDNLNTMNSRLFLLLNTYAATGAAKGDNFELVVICFKALTVLVRDVQYHSISKEQLQVLLTYVEQDIHDYTRQATAFPLLKGILSRKLIVPEMNDVIGNVEKLSITSEQSNARLQCRQVVSQFLLDYPLKKRELQVHLEFFMTNLDYGYEYGRESALEMLATMFNTFPPQLLLEYAGFFFVPLASRLVNDDSPKCRKLASLAIKSLLTKVDGNKRDELFMMCIEWFTKSQVAMRKLSAIVCGIFVEVETSSFTRHLNRVLPIIEDIMEPSRYEEDVNAKEERELDLLLYNVIIVLVKIFRECNMTALPQYTGHMRDIMKSIEVHLLHPHTWVRLAASQMLGTVFASWSPEQLVKVAQQKTEGEENEQPKKKKKKKNKDGIKFSANDQNLDYLTANLDTKLYQLCKVFCTQLTAKELSVELADQIIKNLVFIVKILKLKPDGESFVNTLPNPSLVDNDQAMEVKSASIQWLMQKLCKEATKELITTPKQTVKRSSIYKWMAAISLDLPKEKIIEYLPRMLQPLVRDFTNKTPYADESLKTLVQEVVDLLKTTVGIEVFSVQYATVYNKIIEKRTGRKQEQAVEVITNPELAAMKKMKKNLAKRDAQKRKISEKRPSLKIKRKKFEKR